MATASELPKLYQGVHKESFGFKMLATMGWKEGQGLGANHQGIKEHIKVKKKQDAFGVGAAEQAHKLRDWTTGMVGYDAILSGLKEITRSAKADSSSDDSDSSSGHSSGYDSDSDTSSDAAARKAGASKKKKTQQGQDAASKKKQGSKTAAAGAKDSSSKKKRKQQDEEAAAAKKRQKRNKKADSSSSDDSSSSSGSDSDSDAEPAPSAGGAAALGKVSRVRAATHVGRYAKRERAKTVRNYSATDLAAILGLPSSAPVVEGGEGADAWAAAAAAAAGGNNARQAGSSSSSSDDGSSSSSGGGDSDSDDSSGSGKEGSEQRLRPGTPEGSDTPPSRSQQGLEQDALQSKPLGLGAQNADAGQGAAEGADGNAWWRSLFVKSGGSGSSIGMKAAGKAGINAHGFLEDDQTNLYMQAHANATTGKQGLGRSSMPKKVAGARWQGTKIKLGSDDEDDEQQQQQQQHEAAVDSIAAAAAASGREQYVKNGILIVLPLKKQPAQQQQQQQQQQQEVAQQKDEQQGKKEKKGKKQKQGAAHSPAQQPEPQQQQQQQQRQQEPAGKKRKQQEAAAAAAAAAEPTSSKKAKKAAAAAATATAAADSAGEASQKSVKWAKLAAKILQGAPKRRMRIQKLHKQVVAAAGYDVSSPGVDTEALYQQMLKKLRKAEGLEVCEKYVGLVKA